MPRHRRWRRLLVILLPLALLLGAAAWWFLPAPMQRVGRYEVYVPFGIDSGVVEGSRAGFLLQHDARTLVLHDWQTGATRYRIIDPTAPPSLVKRDITSANRWIVSLWQRPWALSRNGDYVTKVTADAGRLHVCCWHRDTLLIDRTIALPSRDFRECSIRPFVSNQGRTYVLVIGLNNTTRLYRIERNGTAVSGNITPAYDGIDPDTDHIFTYWTEVSRIEEARGRLRIISEYRAPKPVFAGLTGNLVALPDGRLYRRKGTTFRPAGTLAGTPIYITASGWVLARGKKGRFEVRQPGTGQSWSFSHRLVRPAPTPFSRGVSRAAPAGPEVFENQYALSEDGRRCVVLTGMLRRAPAWAEQVTARVPALHRLFPDGQFLCLHVYERPGRLRARLVIPSRHPQYVPLTASVAISLSFFEMMAAPDSRAVLLGPMRDNQGWLWCDVYRW